MGWLANGRATLLSRRAWSVVLALGLILVLLPVASVLLLGGGDLVRGLLIAHDELLLGFVTPILFGGPLLVAGVWGVILEIRTEAKDLSVPDSGNIV